MVLGVFLVYGFTGGFGGMISGCFSYIANRCDILADQQTQYHSSDVASCPISSRPNEGQIVRKLAEESERAQESEGVGRDVGRSVQKMSRISILQSGVSIGYAGGYFLGGFIMQYWGFRVSFAVLAVINVFNFLYVLLLVPEIKPSSQIKKNPTRMYGSLAEISAPLQQFSKPDAQQNSQTPIHPISPSARIVIYKIKPREIHAFSIPTDRRQRVHNLHQAQNNPFRSHKAHSRALHSLDLFAGRVCARFP